MNDLHELLHDAVADVEPADRLSELRARTADPVHTAARPWFYAAGATVLATAAAVTVFAVLDDGPADPGHHHGMAMEPPVATQLVPAYFVGDDTRGKGRLYREFDKVAAGDPLQRALDRIQQPATDPDYRTAWARGSFDTATLADGTIQVEVGAAGLPAPDGIAAQQLVYTLQGVVGERLPVQFVDGGRPLGAPYEAAPQADVLNPVSISDPAEGNAYTGSFTARGRANSFEGTVPWELRQGATVVRKGFATATGAMDRLYPWETTVDLAGLAPGDYTFVAMTDDPSDGEGPGPFTDTRTISVR